MFLEDARCGSNRSLSLQKSTFSGRAGFVLTIFIFVHFGS
jgi:hypothetical protein